jgi:carbon-monoxide dehydrogenase medium subunit
VIPAPFEYAAPATVEEALALLTDHGDDAKLLAGGQSLLPVMRMRMNAPELVVDLGRVESLQGVRDDGDALVVGAMTSYQTLLDAPAVHEHLLLLAAARGRPPPRPGTSEPPPSPSTRRSRS